MNRMQFTRGSLVQVGFGLLFLLGLVAGCGKTPTGSPTDAQITGQLYTNRFFGLTVFVPPGWTVGELKPPFTAPPSATGAAPATRNDAHTHQLLMLSEKPLNSPAQTNASLLIMAELASRSAGIRDAKDYLARVSQFMVDSSVTYRPITPITDIRLGGLPAARLDFAARLPSDKTGWQTYVVSMRNGYAIAFILSASSEAGIRRLDQALTQVRFSKL